MNLGCIIWKQKLIFHLMISMQQVYWGICIRDDKLKRRDTPLSCNTLLLAMWKSPNAIWRQTNLSKKILFNLLISVWKLYWTPCFSGEHRHVRSWFLLCIMFADEKGSSSCCSSECPCMNVCLKQHQMISLFDLSDFHFPLIYSWLPSSPFLWFFCLPCSFTSCLPFCPSHFSCMV